MSPEPNPANIPFIVPASQLPGVGMFVEGEDSLRLNVWSSVAATARVVLRFMGEDGQVRPVVIERAGTADRVVATRLHPLGVGRILSGLVYVSEGAPLHGQCFVTVEVVRGFSGAVFQLAVLFVGYVTSGVRLGWPGAVLQPSLEGRGAIRCVAGADPAANAEFTQTVPTGALWRLLSVFARLVTDATAANREATLIVDDGTTTCCAIPIGTNHAASLTRDYHWATHNQRNTIAQALILQAPLPDLLLPAGYRISSSTSNRQAGDNWGVPQFLVEEWIAG